MPDPSFDDQFPYGQPRLRPRPDVEGALERAAWRALSGAGRLVFRTLQGQAVDVARRMPSATYDRFDPRLAFTAVTNPAQVREGLDQRVKRIQNRIDTVLHPISHAWAWLGGGEYRRPLSTAAEYYARVDKPGRVSHVMRATADHYKDVVAGWGGTALVLAPYIYSRKNRERVAATRQKIFPKGTTRAVFDSKLIGRIAVGTKLARVAALRRFFGGYLVARFLVEAGRSIEAREELRATDASFSDAGTKPKYDLLVASNRQTWFENLDNSSRQPIFSTRPPDLDHDSLGAGSAPEITAKLLAASLFTSRIVDAAAQLA